MSASEPRRSSPVAHALRELVPLLVALALVHFGFRAGLPNPRLWGDENHYLAIASLDVEEGRASLLPGALRFDHRPELASRVFGLALDESALVDNTIQDTGHAFSRLERLQIFLCLLAVALTWMQAKLLGLGRAGAWLAGAVVGLHPWFAFHAHALWPEMLHAVLFGVTLTCVIRHLQRGALGWLVPAGLAAGYAVLAKGTVLPFLPLLTLFLALVALIRPGRSIGKALGAAAIFASTALLVALPQAFANDADGNGARLSANRWWNLELGLTPPVPIDPAELAFQKEHGLARGDERWLGTLQTSRNYFTAAPDPIGRESLARERTLAHVRERGYVGCLLDQIPKLARLVVQPEPAFEQAVSPRARWGEPAPLGLGLLVLPGRLAWWALLLAAAASFVPAVRRSPGWAVVGLFVLYMFAALLLVPVKFRFALPLLPALALFAGAALDLWAGRRSRNSVAHEANGGQSAPPSDQESD